MDRIDNQMESNMDAGQQITERARGELWPPMPYEAWKQKERDELSM